MNTKQFYNKLYGENPSFYKRKSLILETITNLPLKKESKILDLGCGQGLTSFNLSELGFEVTAVDLSDIAIEQLKEQCKKSNLKIKTHYQDIINFEFKEKYNLIMSLMTLQYLSPEERSSLINKMKSNTFAEGYNLITIPTQTKIATNFKNAMKNKIELKEFYKDWKIIILEEETIRFNNSKKGTIAKILAQKPT
jgi:tellurite methyltransferase